MKLSQMTTDRAADVLCEITPYVASIASDEELLAELRNAIDPKEALTRAELMVKGVEKLVRLVLILLKKRKMDVFGILAAMNEKTADEIGQQGILTTAAQIREVVRDRDFMDFFRSCADVEGSV